MKVGVVSDTHLPRFGDQLPAGLLRGLGAEGVERILHLGDFTGPEIPRLFETVAPLEAVAGNNDPPTLVRRHHASSPPRFVANFSGGNQRSG